MNYTSQNPYTLENGDNVASITPQALDALLIAQDQASQQWRATSVETRLQQVSRLGDATETHRNTLAHWISWEMGKPITQALAEVDKCILLCKDYGPEFISQLHIDERHTGEIHHDPLGIILGIFPWNFPLWQAYRVLIPNLIAGNTLIMKQAPNLAQFIACANQVFKDAELDHLAQFSYLSNDHCSALIQDPRIKGITFTGSSQAGRVIASQAGQALKPCILELGGSDPFIVLDDADIATTAAAAARGRFLNAGQTCIAAKRFVVHNSILADFLDAFKTESKAFQLDDPLNATTTLGPLARPDLKAQLLSQYEQSIALGAILETPPTKDYPHCGIDPIILSHVTPEMPVMQDETFGPLAAVIGFDTTQEAITIANNTPYGLGASIWSQNIDEARKLIPNIHAGTVTVNQGVHSDPFLPFGGIKDSGFGRELGSEGLLSFTNTKTVKWRS